MGSMNSILSSTIAEEYFSETIYQNTALIKTAVGESQSDFKADIIAFPEFNSICIIKFVLFDFRNDFDELIGLNDLKRLHLTL